MKRAYRSQELTVLTALFFLISLGACKSTPLEKDLVSHEYLVRAKALQKLAQLSDRQKADLVPLLIVEFRNPDSLIMQRAADALGEIGAPAVPGLQQLLVDPDPYIRIVSIETLAHIGQPSASALPDIIKALQDQHPLVREGACVSLKAIGPQAESAVQPLLALIKKEKEADVKAKALAALDSIGTEEAKKALQQLQKIAS